MKQQRTSIDSAENRRRELVRITSDDMNNMFTDADYDKYESKMRADGLKMLKINSMQN